MKIAIWSDLHIGRRMYRTDETGYNKYEQLGYKALQDNVNAIRKEMPDLIINAGDVFETANPSVLALNHYFKAQRQLTSFPTMTILGNHDFAFANRRNNCSAAEIVPHTYFANYELKVVELNDIAFILMPYIYDTADNIQTYMNNCADLAKSSKCSKKILVTHGVTDRYFREHFIDDPIKLSDDFIKLFDVVIIGHIHTPFEYKEGNTLVISPGAMIDYQAYVDRTGPVILDTDTMEYRRIRIKTPHIIKCNCNETDINDLLLNVGEDIYHIIYDGDPEAINNDLFIQAKNKAVNLTIEPVQHDEVVEEKVEEAKKLMPDLYSWVATNYPDYTEHFEKAKGECRQ